MTGLGRTPYDEGLAWTWRSDCPSKVSRAKSKSRGVVCVSVVKRKTATARSAVYDPEVKFRRRPFRERRLPFTARQPPSRTNKLTLIAQFTPGCIGATP